MNLEIIKTPWECDDIVFLPGDWEISRASEVGKYQYSVSGIASRNLATAADLVKWKMAKLLSLDLLLPWDNEGITFVDGVEILRDFVRSSGKDKYYLIHDGSSTGLLRVNKYYLVKEKLATPSDALKQTVSGKKVKSKKYNRCCEPWPDDDIFILDTEENETIARGASPGLYRVRRPGGTIVSWRATELLSEGKALAGFDIRLEELSSCDNASMQEYFDATCGFWGSSIGNSPSFSEIAHIWSSLQNNPNGTIGSALLSEINQKIDSCKAFNERFAAFNDKANDVDDAIKTIQPKVLELENIYSECKAFLNQTVADDFSSFPENVESYIAAKNEIDTAYKDILRAFTEIDEILSLIKLDVSKIKDVRFFPHNLLPQEYVVYLQSKEDEYLSVTRELRDFSPYDLRMSDLRAAVELIKSVMEQMDISSIRPRVEQTMARKSELDIRREEISRDDKFRKKPGLFSKPNKEDGIKYTTGVHIKNKLPGIYSVTYSGGSVDVTVLELIYLGLAERT